MDVPSMYRRVFLRSVEKRASGIADGVDRLRYLRSSAAKHDAVANGITRTTKILAVCAGACALILIVARVSLTPPAGAVSLTPTSPVLRTPAVLRISATPPQVWLVEQKAGYSIYSNGLQIRNEYTADTAPRRYRVLSRKTREVSKPLSAPAGIVFHTSESQMVPFEPHRNDALRRYGVGLLAYVRQKRLYNFIIDRFGRVYRIVPETQDANHAGHSVWADDSNIYIDLNRSFIGVSFEAQTSGLQRGELNAAQIHSGRILTEMLRAIYRIRPENCVTHAQVSVNPDNMQIGYHTDWASRFPSGDIGLSNLYDQPIPGIILFGFEYDSKFLDAIGGSAWQGLLAADRQLESDAKREGLTPAEYRKNLQKTYRETVGNLSALEEKLNEN